MEEIIMPSTVQQLIQIFWSDITNKEVIIRTYEVISKNKAVPESLSRFTEKMKEFLVPGSELSPFLIVEPFGEALHKLEPVYYREKRSLFYQEESIK